MIKKFLKNFYFILSEQFGFYPIRFIRGIVSLPSYIRDLYLFRTQFMGTLSIKPCLHDKLSDGGDIRGEYFWQDLVVAQMIFDKKPSRHLDVGSRIDGFVAHVASYRHLDVCDIRPIDIKIPNVKFKIFDISGLQSADDLPEGMEAYDSVSCLHVIEHFGLGRYGDKVQFDGYQKGISGLSHVLKKGGTLYLSTPIGSEKVEFNANWIFDPLTIIEELNLNNFQIQKLILFDGPGNFTEADISKACDLNDIRLKKYVLGLFICEKVDSC